MMNEYVCSTTNLVNRTAEKNKLKLSAYKIFFWFVAGGVVGFLIETVWCWFDFGQFTSRTSNLFFPMSCVWGTGCVMICILQYTNRWNNLFYIFVKNMICCALFEFVCGWFGQIVLGVTFWDYTAMPLHIGKYVNMPFCLLWGLLSLAWGKWIYPILDKKLETFLAKAKYSWLQLFVLFMIVTNVISGTALLRMRERQKSPKMKDAVSGEKIYRTNAY